MVWIDEYTVKLNDNVVGKVIVFCFNLYAEKKDINYYLNFDLFNILFYFIGFNKTGGTWKIPVFSNDSKNVRNEKKGKVEKLRKKRYNHLKKNFFGGINWFLCVNQPFS